MRKWFTKRPGTDTTPASTPDVQVEELETDTIAVPSAEDNLRSIPRVDDSHFGTEFTAEFSRDRVIDYFIKRDLKFTIDDDGDVVGVWDGSPFWFLFMGPEGKFFQVRGRWHRKVAHHNRTFVMQMLNDWNREKLWPKAFIREDEDGLQNSIYGEATFDFSEGVTSKQLHYTLDYSLQCTLQLFEHLGSLVGPDSAQESDQA
jgi:hypothetical protein